MLTTSNYAWKISKFFSQYSSSKLLTSIALKGESLNKFCTSITRSTISFKRFDCFPKNTSKLQIPTFKWQLILALLGFKNYGGNSFFYIWATTLSCFGDTLKSSILTTTKFCNIFCFGLILYRYWDYEPVYYMNIQLFFISSHQLITCIGVGSLNLKHHTINLHENTARQP